MSTELNNSQGEKWQNFLQKKGSLRPLCRDPYTARVLLSPPQQTLAVLLVSQEHLINLPQSHSPLKADLTYHRTFLLQARSIEERIDPALHNAGSAVLIYYKAGINKVRFSLLSRRPSSAYNCKNSTTRLNIKRRHFFIPHYCYIVLETPISYSPSIVNYT